MQVIGNEKLMSSAKMVGRSLQSSFQKLMDKYEEKLNVPYLFLTKILRHECLGDIRGSGLIWAIEIVNNKRENKPVKLISSCHFYSMFAFQEPKLASEIMYRLKGKQVTQCVASIKV